MLKLVHKDTFGPLPTSSFDLVNDGEIVGLIQIRHKPSNASGVPEECASHVYYEINEEERGKGYGKKILELGKEKAKEIGLEELIITCDEDNQVSKKIIESNGGVFDGECNTADGVKMLRFKIK